jgi:hypothetical protein
MENELTNPSLIAYELDMIHKNFLSYLLKRFIITHLHISFPYNMQKNTESIVRLTYAMGEGPAEDKLPQQMQPI